MMPLSLVRAITLELARLHVTDLEVSHPPDMAPGHVFLSCEDRDIECDGALLLSMLMELEDNAPEGAFDARPGSVWHVINVCEVDPVVHTTPTPFARDRLTAIAATRRTGVKRFLQIFSRTPEAGPLTGEDSETTPGNLDAALDALHLVRAGEATCLDHFAGVRGPGGDWSWGRDCEDLPPWLAEGPTCSAEQIS